MDKQQSAIELQKIDCNCNNCKYLDRDIERFKKSLEFHYKLQLDEFEKRKKKLSNVVDAFYKSQEFDKGITAENQLNKMKFQFDKKSATINYGQCNRLGKAVSFIPDVLQLDTQKCFEHRST